MRHNICDTVYPVMPTKFLSGRRCPTCMVKIISDKQLKSHEQYCKNVTDLVDNEYEVVSEYIGANRYIDMKHNICGNIYPIKANNFLTGRRCPVCAESKGEQIIRKYLEKHNISFEPQKNFEDLVGLRNGNLSFDFYISKYNLLIEYQGEFHDGSGGDYTTINLDKQKEHDKRKRNYANVNNMNFLEIWYYDFDNIEIILDEKLNNYKKCTIL